jgi:ABC-type polysaccharide/polyol phosphate export permease
MLREGLADLVEGAKLHPTWRVLAWRDMKSQTNRTLLGPFWSILATGIQVAALGYVFGALLKTDPTEGYPYIAAGLILWFFISGSVLGGLGVFQGGAGVLKERSLPVSFTVYRYTFRLLAELCFKFVVFAIVAVLAGIPPNWNMTLVLPGLLLFVLNGLWVILLFGVIGARLRDVRELISPLMLLAFLATPVLWQQASLAGGSQFIATYNPFTHYLAIVREPLLGHALPLSSFAVVVVLTIIGLAASIVTFSLAKNRIVFWL